MTHNGGRCQQKARDGGRPAAHTGALLSPLQPLAYLHLSVDALKVSEWARVFLKDHKSNTG